jgi:hypothetical protein
VLGLGKSMSMRNTFVISKARGCFIEVVHDSRDYGSWVVRRCKKIMWFRKYISSHQFINKEFAFAFAADMKRKYERQVAHA